jgi:hypothetical protein
VWPSEVVDDEVWATLNCHLVGDQKIELVDLMKNFPEIFPTQAEKLGRCNIELLFIDTGDSRPLRQRARRYSQWQQNEIMRHFDELIKMEIIVP